jgi:hypothetical protein
MMRLLQDVAENVAAQMMLLDIPKDAKASKYETLYLKATPAPDIGDYEKLCLPALRGYGA